MTERLDPRARSDPYGRKINRTHSPLLAFATPWLTIMLASYLPSLPVVAGAPFLPPAGFIALLGWRMIRPGLLPPWAGIPLGMFDDLFSGQPFGSAILLWSLALLAIEVLETRIPWRNFLQDWLAAGVLVTIYIIACALFSGLANPFAAIPVLGPQFLLSLLLYPMFGRMVAFFDRLRLLRIRTID